LELILSSPGELSPHLTIHCSLTQFIFVQI
jgi:hypothetical protein